MTCMRFILIALLLVFHTQCLIFERDLNILNFNTDDTWVVDAFGPNEIYNYHSIFWYEGIGHCLTVRIIPKSANAVQIQLQTKDLTNLLTIDGFVNGNVLYNLKYNIEYDNCPNQDFLDIVYTDYQNVVAIKGNTTRSMIGNLIILKNLNTSLTHEELKSIEKSIFLHFHHEYTVNIEANMSCSENVNFTNLFHALAHGCALLNTEIIEKQQQFNWMTFKIFLTLSVIAGFVWIFVYVKYWLSDKRKRNIIVPN